jgi:hypothetical protein
MYIFYFNISKHTCPKLSESAPPIPLHFSRSTVCWFLLLHSIRVRGKGRKDGGRETEGEKEGERERGTGTEREREGKNETV